MKVCGTAYLTTLMKVWILTKGSAWLAQVNIGIAKLIFYKFEPDYFLPTLPTINVVSGHIRSEMTKVGLEWDGSGAWLDPRLVVENMISSMKPTSSDHLTHIQVVADGVRVYRHTMICNIGLKLFDESDVFNSLSSMHLM